MLTRAYERMLDLAIAALHERHPGRLWPLIRAELPRACGGDFIVRKSEDWTESTGTIHIWTPEGGAAVDIDDQTGRVIRRGYPWIDDYRATKDATPGPLARSWAGGHGMQVQPHRSHEGLSVPITSWEYR